MKKSLKIRSYTAEDASWYIDELAKLRMNVFRDFPYLYDGSMKYEKEYLQTYLDSSDSIIVIAFDHDKVIGASTAKPMAHETLNVTMPWLEKGYDIEHIFYFGESVLLKQYRGKGIGVEFFRYREQWAASTGKFSFMTFCAVIRPNDHPMRPTGYQSLESFWQRRGFEKVKGLTCTMSWKDIDQPGETEKHLQFWKKEIFKQSKL